MSKQKLLSGVVHTIPSDLRSGLSASSKAHDTWNVVTPLARNEWICWITSAKKDETRKKRLKRAVSELAFGKRWPCCWAGCPHR